MCLSTNISQFSCGQGSSGFPWTGIWVFVALVTTISPVIESHPQEILLTRQLRERLGLGVFVFGLRWVAKGLDTVRQVNPFPKENSLSFFFCRSLWLFPPPSRDLAWTCRIGQLQENFRGQAVELPFVQKLALEVLSLNLEGLWILEGNCEIWVMGPERGFCSPFGQHPFKNQELIQWTGNELFQCSLLLPNTVICWWFVDY